MTSVAFIAGVIPLMTATGAGSEVSNAMGITVFSGMIGVTFFGLVLTPAFYLALRSVVLRKRGRGKLGEAEKKKEIGTHGLVVPAATVPVRKSP